MKKEILAEGVELYLGDCLDVLPELSGIDAVVTDPPYGLSFMGKRWDYDVPAQAIWEACLASMKPGAHLLAFAGTRTQHRMAVRIEDAGFEIRDMIAWVYGSGFPKSHNLDGDKKGWGTALKPALEPITVARKPLIGTVADNVLAHGTGALNIDKCRVGVADWGSRPPRTPNAILGGGKGTNLTASDAPEGMGRWPANLIHDGSEDVTGLFPVTAPSSGRPRRHSEFKSVAKGREAPRTTFGHDDNGGSAARFFYCAKASKADRDEGLEGFALRKVETMNSYSAPSEGRTADKNGGPRANIHPTVKPTDLMRYLCRLVNPPGGVALDPFMGSGSTGKAAALEGFGFIGIERDETYFDIARRRIEHALKTEPLELF